MAVPNRHAAWHTPRSYSVKLLDREGSPLELARGLTDFLDAFEFASEWLDREDPTRQGTTSLAIFASHCSAECISCPIPDMMAASWKQLKCDERAAAEACSNLPMDC